ncbi:cache domain-containing protein [Rhizobium deserti]|nr:cache domain-containing protein [Rhizobium deserti]
MTRSKISSTAPPLSIITLAFVLLSMSVGIALAYKVINDRIQSLQEADLRRAVETRLSGVQTALGQALYREWTGLSALVPPLSSTAPSDLQDELTVLAGRGDIISWAGYASSDGIVRSASNGLLVGASVSARPWFQRGLRGSFAGDAHEAVLLASKLPPSPNGEPVRFLDLATPIKDDMGNVAGVLGIHINLEWAALLIKQLANSLAVDVFIVNPAGEVVISSAQGSYSGLQLASFRKARAGVAGVDIETWPDGQLYYTATLPEASYRDLPKFGWSIVARIGADAAIMPARSLSAGLMFDLAVFGLLLLLLAMLFIVAFIQPFRRLAKNAEAIAEGDDVYPYESGRTSELAMIGASLARLQSRAAANLVPGVEDENDEAIRLSPSKTGDGIRHDRR